MPGEPVRTLTPAPTSTDPDLRVFPRPGVHTDVLAADPGRFPRVPRVGV